MYVIRLIFRISVLSVTQILLTYTFSSSWQLVSHLETNPYAFYLVASTATATAISITVLGLRRLAQMRKMGINALHGRNSRMKLKRGT